MGELALIGRAAETEIIDRLLGDAFSGRSGVLVLTGEAEAAWRAGNGDRAIALIGLATALPGNAQLRADAAEIRGLVQAQSGTPRQAAAALAAAAQKIAPVDHRRSMRLASIAAEAAWFAGHGERGTAAPPGGDGPARRGSRVKIPSSRLVRCVFRSDFREPIGEPMGFPKQG